MIIICYRWDELKLMLVVIRYEYELVFVNCLFCVKFWVGI